MTILYRYATPSGSSRHAWTLRASLTNGVTCNFSITAYDKSRIQEIASAGVDGAYFVIFNSGAHRVALNVCAAAHVQFARSGEGGGGAEDWAQGLAGYTLRLWTTTSPSPIELPFVHPRHDIATLRRDRLRLNDLQHVMHMGEVGYWREADEDSHDALYVAGTKGEATHFQPQHVAMVVVQNDGPRPRVPARRAYRSNRRQMDGDQIDSDDAQGSAPTRKERKKQKKRLEGWQPEPDKPPSLFLQTLARQIEREKKQRGR